MTAIIAMEPFQRQFNSGTTGVTVSVIFSLYTTWVRLLIGWLDDRPDQYLGVPLLARYARP